MKFLILSVLSLQLVACGTTTADVPDGPVSTKDALIEPYGNLPSAIEENSGMAFSIPGWQSKEQMYTIEDSYRPPMVWVTDKKTKYKGSVTIQAENVDWEDITVAPCMYKNGFGYYFSEYENCVYVADIGDNEDNRNEVHLYYFPEPTDFSKEVVPMKYTFTYEGGSTNAEGLAYHRQRKKFYISQKNYGDDPHVIYELDLNAHLAKKFLTVGVTKPVGFMAISPSGEKFLLGVEPKVSGKGVIWEYDWEANGRKFEVPFLGQHESGDYLEERVFVYGSESTSKVMKVTIDPLSKILGL